MSPQCQVGWAYFELTVHIDQKETPYYSNLRDILHSKQRRI